MMNPVVVLINCCLLVKSKISTAVWRLCQHSDSCHILYELQAEHMQRSLELILIFDKIVGWQNVVIAKYLGYAWSKTDFFH